MCCRSPFAYDSSGFICQTRQSEKSFVTVEHPRKSSIIYRRTKMTTKPVIWTVDDDPDVLRAVERDLRRQYGDRYRVISADSGVSALEATKQLKLRNEPVALFLVDQRMPRMSGVEFLEKAIELYPDAKRALLTAYADTDAAIRAINNVQIDHYLMKPWDPPEERLYGVVDDMLDDWQASYHPAFRRRARHRKPMVAAFERDPRFSRSQFCAAPMAQHRNGRDCETTSRHHRSRCFVVADRRIS